MKHHGKAVSTATPERKKKRIANEVSVESPDKVLASRLRTSATRNELRKRTTIGIYSLKDTSSSDSLFGVPFFAASDNLALLAQKQLLPLANCYHVGTFCLLDGKVSSCVPRIVLDKGV